jgi:hypothetical protein
MPIDSNVKDFRGLFNQGTLTVLVLDDTDNLTSVAIGGATTEIASQLVNLVDFEGYFDQQNTLNVALLDDTANLSLLTIGAGSAVIKSSVIDFAAAQSGVLVLDTVGNLSVGVEANTAAGVPSFSFQQIAPYSFTGGPMFEFIGSGTSIEIRNNAVRNWLGDYAIKIGGQVDVHKNPVGSSVFGLIIEGNEMTGRFQPRWPFLNVGAVDLSTSTGTAKVVRLQKNIFLAPSPPPTVTMLNSPTNDAGLRTRTIRFAAANLEAEPFPAQALAVYVPLDQGVATFTTMPLEEAGFVLAAVARLTSAPPEGANWTVIIRLNGVLVTLVDDPDSASTKPGLFEIPGPVAQGRPPLLQSGLPDQPRLDNQFDQGAQLEVGVTTFAEDTWPSGLGIDVVVDVIVGLGQLGV